MDKNKKIKSTILIFFLILICLIFSYGYYTNSHKFYYEESRKNDGFAGLALTRESEDFIVDGCGTGTMLDTVTGRCWGKNMNRTSPGLEWASANTYPTPIWDEASNVYIYPSPRTKSDYPAFEDCENLVLGDYSDWRLPSTLELASITNEIGYPLTSCTTLESIGFEQCNGYYWTQNSYLDKNTDAWYVEFYSGSAANLSKTYQAPVICVRS